MPEFECFSMRLSQPQVWKSFNHCSTKYSHLCPKASFTEQKPHISNASALPYIYLRRYFTEASPISKAVRCSYLNNLVIYSCSIWDHLHFYAINNQSGAMDRCLALLLNPFRNGGSLRHPPQAVIRIADRMTERISHRAHRAFHGVGDGRDRLPPRVGLLSFFTNLIYQLCDRFSPIFLWLNK